MGESISSSGKKKKKKGLFKSIGKGISFKKKKNRPDDESLVSIAVDNGGGRSILPTPSASSLSSSRGDAPARSVSFGNNAQPIPRNANSGSYSSSANSSSGTSSSIAKPIQVVLLLMDPSSRRFELLQLEFDSNKAMVSDVLRQIQCSATETTLRDMHYVGVSDHTGLEMIAHMKLSRFCKGNDIVLAIPEGMTAKETAKLAGPILGDPKVEDMLAPVGAKVKTKSSKRKASGSKLTKIAEEDNRRKENKVLPHPRKSTSTNSGSGNAKPAQKTSSSSILPTAVLAAIISSLVFFTFQRHVRVTKPLESGDVLNPGQWKSQCGIFDLLPREWLGKMDSIPLMSKLSSGCDTSTSSMLEYGRDGTLRYFTKDGGEDREREEKWRVEGGLGGEDCDEEECDDDEECECDSDATFVKEGVDWYVEMDGTRTRLHNDVIQDFAVKN